MYNGMGLAEYFQMFVRSKTGNMLHGHRMLNYENMLYGGKPFQIQTC